MTKPRLHHYVQRAHLKLFESEEGRLHVCDKNGGRFETTARGVFAERDLYAFADEDDVNVEFEEAIARIEGRLFPAVQSIADDVALTPESEAKVKIYMALSVVRSPVEREGVHTYHRHAFQSFAHVMEARGDLTPFSGCGPAVDGKVLTELIEEGLVDLTIHNSRYLDILRDAFPKLAAQLKDLKLSLLASPAGRIAIGDHPVTWFHPGESVTAYGLPLVNPKSEVTFPISREVCLIGRWGDGFPASDAEGAVAQVNRRQAIFARRHVASQAQMKRLEGLMTRYRGVSYAMEVNTNPTVHGGSMIVHRRDILPTNRWAKLARDVRPLERLL